MFFYVQNEADAKPNTPSVMATSNSHFFAYTVFSVSLNRNSYRIISCMSFLPSYTLLIIYPKSARRESDKLNFFKSSMDVTSLPFWRRFGGWNIGNLFPHKLVPLSFKTADTWEKDLWEEEPMFLLTSKTDGARFPPPLFSRADWLGQGGAGKVPKFRTVPFSQFGWRKMEKQRNDTAYFSPGKNG